MMFLHSALQKPFFHLQNYFMIKTFLLSFHLMSSTQVSLIYRVKSKLLLVWENLYKQKRNVIVMSNWKPVGKAAVSETKMNMFEHYAVAVLSP